MTGIDGGPASDGGRVAGVAAYREARLRRLRRAVPTVARALAAHRGRPRPAVPDVDGESLRALIAATGAEARLVGIPVNRPPWKKSGLLAKEGDRVSWLAWGSLQSPPPVAAGFGPAWVLRGRVGGGEVQRSARDTFTFSADASGPVMIDTVFPGEVGPSDEIVTDRIPFRVMRGRMEAVVVRWPAGSDPQTVLAELASGDPSGLCGAEAERLADPPEPPAGWRHHPLTGEAEVYAESEDGVTADCRDTVAIIRRPAEIPLTADLRLRWTWRLDELPSRLPEDTLLTHDYLSIALEFDDGQDLTWHWSCSLPEGYSYRCPLDHWRRRETHVVVRSGLRDIGKWVSEERPVLADHRAAIGGTPPARVARAWLIAVSVFGGGTGRGEFGRAELVAGERVVRII